MFQWYSPGGANVPSRVIQHADRTRSVDVEPERRQRRELWS